MFKFNIQVVALIVASLNLVQEECTGQLATSQLAILTAFDQFLAT